MRVRWENKPYGIIPDEDVNCDVYRIIFDGTLLGGQYDAIETIKQNSKGIEVYSSQGNWYCGVRLFSDENTALQICFNGGNMRLTYRNEILYPKINTILGTIFFFDVSHFSRQELKHQIAAFEVYANFTPYILACCNSNNLYSWVLDLDALSIWLGLPVSVPIVTCDVKDFHSVRNVIITFLKYIHSLPQAE